MAAAQLVRPIGGARRLGGRTLGVLAVTGVIVGFSLSSTLVKRAETPGVVIAFWRLAVATIVWNAYVWATGRRVTVQHVRQALVPGVFFGLNLAVFFAGAIDNSVANAALIGSLAPFFIVPIGATLFGESHEARALAFAVVAFGGVGLVLFSAPPHGDASLKGNVFGFVAVLLLVAYVVSTRHFRGDMDVSIFMATVCPIATLAVLPIAVASGDGLGMTSTGWRFMLILTFLSGVAANGLMVFAQKTVQIGTISIAQVIQPAVAVVWSFLLLGETLRVRQAAGITVALAGLCAFLVLNLRGARVRRAKQTLEMAGTDDAPAGPVAN